MPKPKSKKVPKRALASTLEASIIPPMELSPQQTIARLIKAEGNHLYSVVLPGEFTSRLDVMSARITQDTTPANTSTTTDAGSNTNSDAGTGHYLVELTSALRSNVFLRRNGYVLVDCDRELLGGRENKIIGIIVGVVLGGKTEREWRKMTYWPGEFGEVKAWDESGSGSDEDRGPRMPESESDDDD